MKQKEGEKKDRSWETEREREGYMRTGAVWNQAQT